MLRVLVFSASLAMVAALLSSCAAHVDSDSAGLAVDTPVADASVGVD